MTENYTIINAPGGFTPIDVDTAKKAYIDVDLMKKAKIIRKNNGKSNAADLENLLIIREVAESECWRADGYKNAAEFVMYELDVKLAYAYRLLQAGRYVKRFPDGKVHSVFKPYFNGDADFTAGQLKDVVANKKIKENPELLVAIIQSGAITPATRRTELESLINKALALDPTQAENTENTGNAGNTGNTGNTENAENTATNPAETAPATQKAQLLDMLYKSIGSIAEISDFMVKAHDIADSDGYIPALDSVNSVLEILRTIAGNVENF